MLPGAKVTPEIAEIRGIPEGKDCVSPSRHAEFDDVDSMLDWVELLADETGLPVGIKSAVGDMGFWESLVEQMRRGDRGALCPAQDLGRAPGDVVPPRIRRILLRRRDDHPPRRQPDCAPQAALP